MQRIVCRWREMVVAGGVAMAMVMATPPVPAQSQPNPEPPPAVIELPEVLRQRVEQHIAAGRTVPAIVTLERIIAGNPANAREYRLRVAELYFDMIRYGSERDLREAVGGFQKHLDALMTAAPDDPAANLLFARFMAYLAVHLGTGREHLERAAQAAGTVLEADGNAPAAIVEARLIVARAAMHRGDAEAAAAHLVAALAADAGNIEATSSLFQLLISEAIEPATAAPHTALSLARKLVSVAEMPARRRHAVFVAITECVKVGDGTGAVNIIDTALAEFPDFTLRLARRIVERYHAQDLPGRAALVALDALSTNPAFWSASTESAVRGSIAQVPAGQAVPELHALLGVVIAHGAADDLERARAAFSAMEPFVAVQKADLSEFPELLDVHANLALQIGEMDTALREFTALAGIFPARTDISRRRDLLAEAQKSGVPARAVWLYLQSYEHPERELVDQLVPLKQALTLAPDYARAHHYRADLAFNLEGDFAAAYTHYAKAAETLGDEREVKHGLAFAAFFTAEGAHIAQAKTLFAQLAERYPDAPHYAEFLRLIGEIESGAVLHKAFVFFYRAALAETAVAQQELLAKAAEVQPRLFEVLLMQGRAALMQGVDWLQRLPSLTDDDFAMARDEMAAHFEGALRLFSQAAGAARRAEQRSDALTFRARTLYLRYQAVTTQEEAARRRADLTRCADFLQLALDESPTNAAAAMLLGEVRAMLGEVTAAHAVFRDIIARVPDVPMFRFDSYASSIDLPLPEGAGRPAENAVNVALQPAFVGRQRFRYKIDATLAGFPTGEGKIGPADTVSFRVELSVREVPTPGFAECDLDVLSVEGNAAPLYRDLLDTTFRVTISTVLGRISWQNPPVPDGMNADVFTARAEQFSSLVAPLIFEAWSFSSGRATTAVGETWQKRDAGGLIHIGANPTIPVAEAYFLAAADAGKTAEIVRVAAMGGGFDGNLGSLRADISYDVATQMARRVHIRMMNLTRDPSHTPARNQATDVAETHVDLKLELLRAD